VFRNASQMTSSIDATNSQGMTEPFTPAGAVSNGIRGREPREPGSDFTGPIGVYASMSWPVSSSIASNTSV